MSAEVGTEEHPGMPGGPAAEVQVREGRGEVQRVGDGGGLCRHRVVSAVVCFFQGERGWKVGESDVSSVVWKEEKGGSKPVPTGPSKAATDVNPSSHAEAGIISC